MDKQKEELSYFKLRLLELLEASFPEKLKDKTFINQRAQRAANAYEGAFLAGNPVYECEQIADFILFEGLYFSKFDTIFKVVCEEFGSLMLEDDIRPFSLKMLNRCESIFANYHLVDDFAYSFEFDSLYTELTGAIAIWIEKHGLQ